MKVNCLIGLKLIRTLWGPPGHISFWVLFCLKRRIKVSASQTTLPHPTPRRGPELLTGCIRMKSAASLLAVALLLTVGAWDAGALPL